MTAQDPYQPPRRPNLWLYIARRALVRLGLPLLALLAVVGVVFFLLRGDGEQPADVATPPTVPGGQAPVQPRGQQPPGQDLPTRPGAASELRVLLPGVSTLDPGLAYDSESIPVVQLLFEGLLAVDEDGSLQPRGAERWEVSADGLTYTFFLDRNARWEDGQPVTAADYVFAWRRNVDPRTSSPYAPVLFALSNGEAIHRGSLPVEQLGVEARDTHTLVAMLEAPAPYFTSLVATWTYFPLRRDLIERFGEEWSHPANLIGNGPYVLESIGPAPEVVLGPNPSYVGARPPVQWISFRAYEGLGQAMDAFLAGELDIMPYFLAMESSVAGEPRLQSALRAFPRSSTTFAVLNTRRPALQDPRVRRALGMAVDRAALAREVTGGSAQPAISLHPEGIRGRDPSLWPREDMVEARRLLAEAGYSESRRLEVVIAVANPADPIAAHLQRRWQDGLGATVRLVDMGGQGMLAFRSSPAWEQDADVYVGSWQSDYEDPHNWFNLLWDSENDRGQYNSGWRNADFDRLVRTAGRELDQARRTEMYRQAEQIMAEQYPLIPLYHPVEQYLVRPEVQDFHPGRTALSAPLLRVRLGGPTPL